ncbi:MAG: primase-helicase family protein [Caulobacteraceae bacterium]
MYNVISTVLGASNCQTVDNNVFDDGYWAGMAKRVLLLINEVQAEDKVGVYNALKSVMADEDFTAKEKYIKARRMMSPRGVFVFSNKAVPMKIEDDDRRFYVLRPPTCPRCPTDSSPRSSIRAKNF